MIKKIYTCSFELGTSLLNSQKDHFEEKKLDVWKNLKLAKQHCRWIENHTMDECYPVEITFKRVKGVKKKCTRTTK